MIVVDANIIAPLLIHSELTEQSEQVLRKDPQWAAPLLWRSELRNLLSFQMRQRGLSFAEALGMMEHAGTLLAQYEHEVQSEDVLRLAKRSTLSAYDCEYVVLASHLSVPLVTTDKQILAQALGIALTPKQYLAR